MHSMGSCHNLYAEGLTRSTLECDCLGDSAFKETIKMRLLGWT